MEYLLIIIILLLVVVVALLLSLKRHSNPQPFSSQKIDFHWRYYNQVMINGWVFICKLSGCGFESSCSHLTFRYRTCFKQGVLWNLSNYRVCIHSETSTLILSILLLIYFSHYSLIFVTLYYNWIFWGVITKIMLFDCFVLSLPFSYLFDC